VGRDAVEHARKNHIDAVLVDTAGRMQTSKNLMDEMAKIVRVVKPDAKLFIGDALAGNDTINQAREFFQYSNFDGAILTKIDADAKGGAAISIAHITSRPIAYVGVGQGYDDIIAFDPDRFIESLFGTAGEVTVEDLTSAPKAPEVGLEAQAASPAAEKLDEERRPAITAPASSGIVAPTLPLKEDERGTKSRGPVPVAAENRMVEEKPEQQPAAPQKAPETQPEKPAPEPLVKLTETVSQKVEEKIAAPLHEPERKEEKKGRFGGFFKKKSDDDREKEENRKRKLEEERARQEEEKAREEEEERQRKEQEKQKEEKKKRKTDKDSEEDKVIYLTDEDIEDLLK
jgi:fused signal recognition particle receptor